MTPGRITLRREGGSRSQSLGTAHCRVEVAGDVCHRETAAHHLFTFGRPGRETEAALAATDVDGRLFDPAFYRGLTGHFSLLIVGKATPSIRIVEGRFNGGRLFVRARPGEAIVSQRLRPLVEEGARPEPAVVHDLLKYRWSVRGESLVAGVDRIHPGRYCDLTLAGGTAGGSYETLWEPRETMEQTLETCATVTEAALATALERLLRPGARVGVLLSGGVDSAVLAALARRCVPHLVAISHRLVGAPNPELDAARRFARELGIEHRVVDVEVRDVHPSFVHATEAGEQPPRNPSAVVLDRLFRFAAGEVDQVLYGEAADTLFGLGVARRYVSRREKRAMMRSVARFVPGAEFLLETFGRHSRAHAVYHENLHTYLDNFCRLKLGPGALALLPRGNVETAGSGAPEPPLDEALRQFKRHILTTGVADHFRETLTLAEARGLETVSPYVHPGVLEVAAGLSPSLYFGTTHVKPVLRRIGARHVSPELMVLPKRGFPVPQAAWMRGALEPLWTDARQRFGIGHGCDEDVEFQWTLAGLDVLFRHLGLDGSGLFGAAAAPAAVDGARGDPVS